MERSDFVTLLKNLAPALAKRDVIQTFQAFCFDGKRVHAFDDVITLEANFDFEAPGGYRGDLLLSWANSIKGKEVALSEIKTDSGPVVEFVCGKSRIKLAQIPTESFLWERPNPKTGTPIPIEGEAIDAISRVLPCVARDSTHPWQYGVTLYFSKKAVRFYATNEITAAYTSIAGKPEEVEAGTTLLLPPRFCDLLVDFGKNAGLTKFMIHESMVVAYFDNGIRLYSRIGAEHSVERFQQIFSAELMKELSEELKPCPAGLKSAIDRASLVLDNGDNHTLDLSIENGRITIFGKSDAGEAKEIIKLPDHPDASGEINPDYLRPVLDSFEEIALLAPRFFAGRCQSTTYLFSLYHTEE